MGKNLKLLSNFTKDSAILAYHQMLKIRKFEEKCGQIYGMGKIAGFCHLCIGQEAISVGVQQVLQKGDSVITGYRDHGHSIIMGTDIKYILAELMGRFTGVSKGKGGSMHLFDIEKGFFGGHGIVGAQVPLGTGLAFAHKYNNTKNIALTFFGDGAANQGQVYEAFNMAKIWNLPVLFVIENNKYAMGTSTERHSASKTFHTRGQAYEIPGIIIDAMNVIEVTEKLKEVILKIRNGEGPMLVEMETYRYRGHSMSDPGKYRSKDEIETQIANHDPIGMFEKALKDEKWIDDNIIDEIETKIKVEIQNAYDFASNSPLPSEDELYTNVYSN